MQTTANKLQSVDHGQESSATNQRQRLGLSGGRQAHQCAAHPVPRSILCQTQPTAHMSKTYTKINVRGLVRRCSVSNLDNGRVIFDPVRVAGRCRDEAVGEESSSSNSGGGHNLGVALGRLKHALKGWITFRHHTTQKRKYKQSACQTRTFWSPLLADQPSIPP